MLHPHLFYANFFRELKKGIILARKTFSATLTPMRLPHILRLAKPLKMLLFARDAQTESACLAILLLTAAILPAQAQTPPPPQQAIPAVEALRAYFSDALDQIDLESIEFNPLKALEWSKLLDMALHEEDEETLAWLNPYAHDALSYFQSVPTFAPLADWLRPRLDYFELAEAAVEQITAPAPPQPPPVRHAQHRPRHLPQHKPPPPLRPLPAVAPPKPPPAVLNELKKQRRKTLRNPANWQKKLSSRPAPEQAAGLAPTLKEVFKKAGLPPELVWMAEVESSFNPKARSPAGAIGLFQLMPPTAQQYGLKTENPDEREAPLKNAGAAARFLRDLHRTFGSWPLALAAYNAGPARIKRALRQNNATTFEAIADSLPLETQLYVPKITALIALRENADLAKLHPPLPAAS